MWRSLFCYSSVKDIYQGGAPHNCGRHINSLICSFTQLKETVIDAIGIGWIFEDGLSKIWSVIAVMILWYVRWSIKLLIFIYGALFITALIFPHSGSAH